MSQYWNSLRNYLTSIWYPLSIKQQQHYVKIYNISKDPPLVHNHGTLTSLKYQTYGHGGGNSVSIMSVFINCQKFYDWMESINALIEKLP